MKEIASCLTDACVLELPNGERIEGAEKVAKVIIRCCEEYNKGFIEGVLKFSLKGFAIGAGITITGLVIHKTIKSRKNKSKKLKEEKA